MEIIHDGSTSCILRLPAHLYSVPYHSWGYYGQKPVDGDTTSNCIFLSIYEAAYLSSLGRIPSLPDSILALLAANAHVALRRRVYARLRDNEWIVRSGVHYGGDFVLYPPSSSTDHGGPGGHHAPYIVLVMHAEVSWTVIAGLMRSAIGAKKELIIAWVEHDRRNGACEEVEVHFTKIKRWIPEKERMSMPRRNNAVEDDVRESDSMEDDA